MKQMRLCELIIFIFLTNLICCINLLNENDVYEFDIISGKPSQILDYLLTTNTYRFYIQSKYSEIIYFQLFEQDKSDISLSQELIIYEYKNRTTKVELIKTEQLLKPNSYLISYKITNSLCNYIAFEIRPKYEMKNVYVKTLVKNDVNYEYNLTNGINKYIGEIIEKKYYRFNIDVKYNQILEIEIFINDDDYLNYAHKFNIYEYDSWLNPFYSENNYYYFDRFTYEKEKTKITYSYSIITKNCSYVGIEIIQNYKARDFNIKIIVRNPEKYEYDIKNDNPIYLENLYRKNIYKFYIKANYAQVAYIKITKKNKFYLNNNRVYLTAYEYSEKDSSEELSKETYPFYFRISEDIFMESYNISNSKKTSYLAFDIETTKNLEKVDILINIRTPMNYTYDLTNGKTIYLGDLFAYNKYKFYLPFEYGNIFHFKVFNFIENGLLKIYEYSNRTDLKELRYYGLTIRSNSDYDYAYYNYEVKNSLYVKYIGFELIPFYDSKSANLTASLKSPFVEYNNINLFNKKKMTLDSPYTYKFYIPAKYNKTVYINFGGYSYLNDNFFSKMNLYEYENIDSNLELIKSQVNPKRNQGQFNLIYTIKSNFCNYIAFSNKVNSNIESLIISVKISPNITHIVNLTVGIPQHFDKISLSDTYKFFVFAKWGQIVDFNLTKKDKDIMEEQYITVYEYDNEISMKELKQYEFHFTRDKNQEYYELGYIIENNECNLVVYEIKWVYEITSVDIVYTFFKEDKYTDYIPDYDSDKTDEKNNSNSFNGSFLLIIAAFVIIVIILIIIILIICCVKNKNKNNFKDLQNLTTETNEPIYPIN